MASYRVLVIGPFADGTLPESFARGFERLGWDVFRFDSDRAYFGCGQLARRSVTRRLFRRRLWSAVGRTTLQVASCVRPHLILAVKATFLDPDVIFRLRRDLGVPVVNYYPDNPYCGTPLDPRKTSAQRRDLIEALGRYTHVWIWERSLAARLCMDDVTASFLPFGVDPTLVERPPAESTFRCRECDGTHPVVFVGQHNVKRQMHIGSIKKTAVSIWGSRWGRAAREFRGRHVIHREPCQGSRAAGLYARATVSLNVLDDLNMPGHNMRTFEIAGSGGLLLSTYTDEQHFFFPSDEAALYYHSPEELNSQIERASSDAALAARLRASAAKIAQDHHYQHRAAEIVKQLGIHVTA